MERKITCKQCGNVWTVPSAGIVDLRCSQCSGTSIQFSCDVKLKCYNPSRECGGIREIESGKIVNTDMCCAKNHLYKILGVRTPEPEMFNYSQQIVDSEIKEKVEEKELKPVDNKEEKAKAKPKKKKDDKKPFAVKRRKRSK